MPNPGRTTEQRTVAALNKTSASTAVTAAAGTFSAEDVGRTVTSTGVNAGTTISAVASDTAATLSANATATNSASATLGPALPANTGYIGWSPETVTEKNAYTVTNSVTVTPPDRITNSTDPRPSQRNR